MKNVDKCQSCLLARSQKPEAGSNQPHRVGWMGKMVDRDAAIIRSEALMKNIQS